MAQNFPNNLISEYKASCNKLKKIDRVIFKRFGPNFTEVSSEFQQLGIKFDNCYLSEYAGLCFLGAAKCERSMDNEFNEVDFLLKGARAFKKADQRLDSIGAQTNSHSHLEGSLRCYYQALERLENNPVMKACIIREITKLKKNTDNVSSNFHSPCHRYHDLVLLANESIRKNDFVSALEKLTECNDDIVERKAETFYSDQMKHNEISRLLLLLYLELPPSRLSPSHIKLMEKYTWNSEADKFFDIDSANLNSNKNLLPSSLVTFLEGLVNACQMKDGMMVTDMRNELIKSHIINDDQSYLLDKLMEKYNPF